MNFIVFLTIAILSFAIAVSQAQTSPEDYLAPHNAARAAVNVGPMEWDDTVAAYASDYANMRAGDCNLIHSTGGPYGENLSKGSGALSVADAVQLWLDEISNYDYQSNSCQGGECGHYTQVVWGNSIRLGCASVTCDDGGTFVICSYDPQGNMAGERPF